RDGSMTPDRFALVHAPHERRAGLAACTRHCRMVVCDNAVTPREAIKQEHPLQARLTRRTLLISTAGLLAPGIACAAFPERTIRILVGFAAGGTVDTIARILANAMGPILGGQVIVENKPGGSGSIAANAAIYAEPDGHTLLFGIFSLAVAPALV